jgi:hypothetical protein
VAVATVKLGDLEVSQLILGGNPFSGFSHWDAAGDLEMKKYYTCERMKAVYREAERLGVNTHIGRADNHVTRVLLEYWEEGGKIQWIAQTPPEYGSPAPGIRKAISVGAKAAFVHGGETDHYLAHGRLDEVAPMIDLIHDAGLPAGIAGHKPEVFEWAEEHLKCDFYMCSHYNPVERAASAEHLSGSDERFREEDRERMVATIQKLSKPAIHYKILAAGRNDPKEAFRYAASKMRAGDAVCVGIYTKDKPNMLAEDLRLLEEGLAAAGRKA